MIRETYLLVFLEVGLVLKVVYHKMYNIVYASDPAAKAGRIESIYNVISPHFEFMEPKPATDEDILRAHSERHVDSIKSDKRLYEVAALAAGGAIAAAELAYDGEPAFGLIRPPGHHASSDSCWGFCFFNNMAIAILKLRNEGKADKVFILDIDLHFGDGTVNILGDLKGISIMNPNHGGREAYLEQVLEQLKVEAARGCDIVAVSAGFDEYELDWGGRLKTEDYKEIASMVKEFSIKNCAGRRFAILEGGYYHPDLGKNVKAFLDGFG